MKNKSAQEQDPPLRDLAEATSAVAATPPAPSSPFTDFDGMHKQLIPDLSARTARELVRKGIIPSIKLPGGRKRLFHLGDVEAALRRHTQGGVL